MALTISALVIGPTFVVGPVGPLDTTSAVALLEFGGVKNDALPFDASDSEFNSYTPFIGVVGAAFSVFCQGVFSPINNASLFFTSVGNAGLAGIAVFDSSVPELDDVNGAAFFDEPADPGSISVTPGSIVFAIISSNKTSGDYAAPTGYTLLGSTQYDGPDGGLWVAVNLTPGSTEQPIWSDATGTQGACAVVSIKPGGSPPVVTKISYLPLLGVG